MRTTRENFLIGGLICIASGAFFTVAGIMSIAGTVGISGILLFIMGMSIPSQLGMTDEEVANWRPESSQLPDAGRIMYRVDVTLDEPKQCSIVCGPCGHVEVVDGERPARFTCSKCSKMLWDEEE
jgi:hypothetical protein